VRHFLFTIFKILGSCYKHIQAHSKVMKEAKRLHNVPPHYNNIWNKNHGWKISVRTNICILCVKQYSLIASALQYSVC